MVYLLHKAHIFLFFIFLIFKKIFHCCSQKSKNASGFKKTESKRKVISVTAVYRQDPVYTVGEDKRVILNVENHTGGQPTSTNDVTDSTID